MTEIKTIFKLLANDLCLLTKIVFVMSQTTIFSDKFLRAAEHIVQERRTKNSLEESIYSQVIFQIIAQSAHWKVQILAELDKRWFEKFKIEIGIITQKSITFYLPHPALIEKVKSIESILLDSINEILARTCPCKKECKERPKKIAKLLFFVKYKHPLGQAKTNNSIFSSKLPSQISKKSSRYGFEKQELEKVSQTGLKIALEQYRKKLLNK